MIRCRRDGLSFEESVGKGQPKHRGEQTEDDCRENRPHFFIGGPGCG